MRTRLWEIGQPTISGLADEIEIPLPERLGSDPWQRDVALFAAQREQHRARSRASLEAAHRPFSLYEPFVLTLWG